MLRYSLGSLFLSLLYLSIGCAALVNATRIWLQIAITLTIAILLLFSLAAIFWTERKRVFAVGFAATGWLYFLLVFSSVTDVRPYLLTETAMNRLFVTMHADQWTPISVSYRPSVPYRAPRVVEQMAYVTPAPPVPVTTSNNPPRPVYSTPVLQPVTASTAYTPIVVRQLRQSSVDQFSFANIGHSMWTLIVAFAGGVTAQLLASRRKPDSQRNECNAEEHLAILPPEQRPE